MTTRNIPYWTCSSKKTNRHGFFFITYQYY